MSTMPLVLLEADEDTAALLTSADPGDLIGDIVDRRNARPAASSAALEEVAAIVEKQLGTVAEFTGDRTLRVEVDEFEGIAALDALKVPVSEHGLVVCWAYTEVEAFGDEVANISTRQWSSATPWASVGRVPAIVEFIRERQINDADPAEPDALTEFVTYTDEDSDFYHYTQLSYRPSAQSFVLEFRNGFDEDTEHHWAFIDDAAEVVALIQRWFAGEEPYDDRFMTGLPDAV